VWYAPTYAMLFKFQYDEDDDKDNIIIIISTNVFQS
jgi:hypothetical protein